MKVQRLVSILVALACITSMGVASTTLTSSLQSSPDKVYNLNYKQLPIGQETAGEVKKDVEENKQKREQKQKKEQTQTQSSSSSTEEQKKQSFWKMLLELLMALLPYIVAALVGLAALVLLSRYWRQLIAPILALIPSFSGGVQSAETRSWFDREPRSEIEAAWFELVKRAGIDKPDAKTPSECASEAIDAGLDPSAVDRLRRVFEEVRYGQGEMTDDQRQQLDRSRRELGLGGTR